MAMQENRAAIPEPDQRSRAGLRLKRFETRGAPPNHVHDVGMPSTISVPQVAQRRGALHRSFNDRIATFRDHCWRSKWRLQYLMHAMLRHESRAIGALQICSSSASCMLARLTNLIEAVYLVTKALADRPTADQGLLTPNKRASAAQ